MKRKSIVFKLFVITTVFLVAFLSIGMIVQTLSFEDFYLDRKIETLEENIKNFSIDYLNGDWDEETLNRKTNIFAEQNNAQIAILDKDGVANYMSSYYINIITENEEYIIIPLSSYLYSIDLNEYKISIGDEVIVEGVSSEDDDIVIPIDIIIGGISLGKDVISENNILDDEEIDIDNIKTEIIKGKIVETNITSNIDTDVLYKEEIFWDAIDEIYWMMQSKDFKIDNEIISYNYKDSFTGIDNIVFVKPIIKGDTINETIFVMSSLQPIGEAIDILKEFYIYALIIIIFLIIILSFIYSKMISKPLIKLNETASKMANLDFTSYCEVKSNDEIGSLSESLNSLSKNLSNTLDELKLANKKLVKDIEKEKNLEKMRKEFISSASHELKTPLGIMKGFAEGIKDGIYEDKKDYYLDVILDEIDKMNNLVFDMLELSKLESKSYKLKKEEFNIDKLVLYVKDKLIYQIEEKNLNININIDKDKIMVCGDKRKIEQVLMNLFSNAIRHSNTNGEITIDINSKDNAVYVCIENRGKHIPEDKIDRIWDRFYRAEQSRDRKSGGTGLGLAIVKNILELHNSKYGVKNTKKGVLFHFTLQKLKNYS